MWDNVRSASSKLDEAGGILRRLKTCVNLVVEMWLHVRFDSLFGKG